MEDELRTVQRWASHGTLRQFASEIQASLSESDEQVKTEVEGDGLTVYRVRKEGGFLGIGARKIREPVLELSIKEGVTTINEETANEDFIHLLAISLSQH